MQNSNMHHLVLQLPDVYNSLLTLCWYLVLAPGASRAIGVCKWFHAYSISCHMVCDSGLEILYAACMHRS